MCSVAKQRHDELAAATPEEKSRSPKVARKIRLTRAKDNIKTNLSN
jgi:hypothetical protein